METVEENYIGEMKERNDFFVKLQNKKQINTTFGERLILTVITKSSKIGQIWVPVDSDGFHTLDIGDCFTFTGTVSKQEVDKYTRVPTTTFNRVKFNKLVTA
jgi:pyruvate dehydrogenase complex dehydrogenase (E1) component